MVAHAPAPGSSAMTIGPDPTGLRVICSRIARAEVEKLLISRSLLPCLDSHIVWLVAGEQIDQGAPRHQVTRSPSGATADPGRELVVISSPSPVLSVARSSGSCFGFLSRGSSLPPFRVLIGDLRTGPAVWLLGAARAQR